MTWEEKLQEIRAELKWVATVCLNGDDTEIAQVAITASLAVSDLVNELHTYGLNDAVWDRPTERHGAGHG
jgi:hypothetical protein